MRWRNCGFEEGVIMDSLLNPGWVDVIIFLVLKNIAQIVLNHLGRNVIQSHTSEG